MIQFKKMSRTAVSAAVLVTIGAAASAGTISVTAVNIAQEAWGPGRGATTAVITPSVGYQFSTPGGIVINPGGTIHVTITPTNGKFASGGAVALPLGTGGSLSGTVTVNTTSGVMDLALANALTAGSNSVIGVGAIVSVGAGTATGVQGLATGTAMSASGSVGVAAGGAELEAASAPSNVLTSSQAVTVAAAASTTETAKIDVTTTTVANIGKVLSGGLVSTAVETLGTVTFTSSTTVAKDIDGTTFNLANTTPYPAANTPVLYTLALASGSFSAGATYSLATGGCGTAGTAVASTQSPTTITAATTSVTLSSVAVPVTATAISVCGTFPGTAAIAPYKATVRADLTPLAPVATSLYVGETLAAANMYDLGYNGASVTVRNYIPSGVTGYIQTVRLINTGSSTATAFVSLIDDTTGAASTPVSVGAAMAPGAAQRLSQATIEAALGYTAGSPMPSTIRPRLRFTAATASMEAQSFFNNANGAYTNLNGQDTN